MKKSYHKSNFLKEVSKKFDLNTKIIQKDVFLEKKFSNRCNSCSCIQTITNNFRTSEFKFY